MGDPSGPWQEYGGGSPRGPGARPPAPPVTPPPLRRPPFLEPPPSVPPGHGPHGYAHVGDDDGLTGDGYGEDGYIGDGYGEDGYIGDGYGEDGYGDAGDEREAGGIAADYGYGRPGGHVATATGLAGLVAAVRAAAADAAWRYRSAPLWARITADVVAGALVLALVVGVSLMLRGDDDPQQAAAREPISIETVPTTSTTVATTTTVPTTTTTVRPTTTTVPPTTVTTSPPIVPPPTVPPSPPTADEVRYRDCFEAWLAGALPLHRGDPGYGPHLDRDGDGEACEFRDDGGGGGGGGGGG